MKDTVWKDNIYIVNVNIFIQVWKSKKYLQLNKFIL